MNIKFKSIIYIFFVVLFVSQVYSIKYSFQEQTCGNVDCVEVLEDYEIKNYSTYVFFNIYSNQSTPLDYINPNVPREGIKTKDGFSYCSHYYIFNYQYTCNFVQKPKIKNINEDLELLKDYNIEDVCSCTDNDIKEFNLTINGNKFDSIFKLDTLKKYEFNCSCEDKIGQTVSNTFEVDHTTYKPKSITNIKNTNGLEILTVLKTELSHNDFCQNQVNCEIKNLENDEIIKTDSLDYKVLIEKDKLYCFEFNSKKICYINFNTPQKLLIDSFNKKVNELNHNKKFAESLFYIDCLNSVCKIVYKDANQNIEINSYKTYFLEIENAIKAFLIDLGELKPVLNIPENLEMFKEYDIEDTCKCEGFPGSTKKLTINDRNVEEKYTFYSLGKYKFNCSCTLDYKEESKQFSLGIYLYYADNLEIIDEDTLKDSQIFIQKSNEIIIKNYFKENNNNFSIKDIQNQKQFYVMNDYDHKIIIEKGKLYCFEDLHDSNQKKCFVYPEEKTINSNKDKINIEEIKIDGKSVIYLNTSDLVYKNNKYYEGNIEFNLKGQIEFFENQNYIFLQNNNKIYNISFNVELIPDYYSKCELHQIGKYFVDNTKYELKDNDGNLITLEYEKGVTKNGYLVEENRNVFVIFSLVSDQNYMLRKCFKGIDLVANVTKSDINNVTQLRLVAKTVFETQSNLKGIQTLIEKISDYLLSKITEYDNKKIEAKELIKDLSPEYLIELKNILNQIKSITNVQEIKR
ncbi:MAG: hypothetical protein PHT94_01840 [Candidatus Nanoarchaeia archaeon]|nr:hypothetical protein [Candidatus Nanoarchaeia archaeon]